jgi:RNA polymerase sigma-70 factor (ECF subfamily)
VSDSDLIGLARQGDDAACEALVRQHQTAVYRLAYLLLGERGDAEDVAQETFIRAFQALDRFDSARPLRPWLLRIASNLARNRRRAAGRYFSALQRAFRAEPELVLGASGETSGRDEAEALWQAVRRLERSDQEIIYLRYFLELSAGETAEALDVAAGTVKSRLHRALARLRAIIQKDLPGLWEGGGS